MRVTFFIGGLSGGGAERVVCNLSNYLVNHEHEVEVLTISEDKSTYFLDEKVSTYSLISAKEKRGTIRDAFTRLVRLRKYLKKKHCDVYVVMIPLTTILLLALKNATKAKIIVSERSYPAFYDKWKRVLLKNLAHRADGWVFQTSTTMEWYTGCLGKTKTIIIPNAINLDFIESQSIIQRRPTIVTVGRLQKMKNHALLLKAFAKICDRHPEYNLEIYGDGDMKQSIIDLTDGLNISSKVRLMGFQKNINEKIKNASLFVLSSNHEGMPNALMEAMALGMPCISTDCDGGGARFLIEEGVNGLLVPKNDVDAMATAMEKLLSNTNLANRLGNEAHRICERLSPEKIYNEWERFLLQVTLNN